MRIDFRNKIMAVGLIVWALATVGPALNAGEMEPWAPPGGTMKPLSDIEPRRIIVDEWFSPVEPFRITQPGSYYLAGDIDATGRWGIEIAVSDVTIDLNGFALKNGFGTAIRSAPDNIWVTQVTVRNGTISGWDSHGIELDGLYGHYVVTDLLANDNGGIGIYINAGQVLDCIARTNGADGIVTGENSLVRGCLAESNGNNGIGAGIYSTVSDCVSTGNLANGIRLLSRSQATGNTCTANSAAGIRVFLWENRIEANHVPANDYGIYLDDDGLKNVVVRNSASSNITQDYYVGTNNDVGPIGTAATVTSPWANIQN